MNKQTFLMELKQGLQANRVPDIDEIVAEYEEHFAHKLADGYTEDEIATKLGDVRELAAEYAAGEQETRPRARLWRWIGLAFADIVIGPLFLVGYVWVAALAVASLAFAALGVNLIAGPLFPAQVQVITYIPRLPSILLGVSVIALGVLFWILTVYCFLFVRKLGASFARWHRSALTGRKQPPYALFPLAQGRARRRLRHVTLASLIAFVTFFTVAYVPMALAAGSLEFWHVWGWFGYVG